MKGIDYSKTLSKEREYFQDTIRKNNDSNEKRIAGINERNDGVVKKQRENFIEDKAELETSYQNNIKKLEETALNSMSDDNKKFHEEREKERKNFATESIAKRKDFDQRLDDITKSYKKSNASEKEIAREILDTEKRKYDRNIADTRSHADKQLKTYRDEVSGQGVDLKDRYDRERQQLVRSHEDAITQTTKQNSIKRAEQKSLLREDFLKSKEVQKSEFELQKQYSGERMATMQKKYDDRALKMAKDFSNRSDRAVEVQQREAVLANLENTKNLTEARRDFNKQLRLIDLDKRRRDNGSGEFSDVMDRQQGLRDATANDNRYNKIKTQMQEMQNVYHERTITDMDRNAQTIKSESADATARLDRKMNEANLDKIVTINKERQNAEKQINNLETQNRLSRQGYESKILTDQNNSTDRMNNLKENFNTAMKRLEENHKVQIEDVQLVSNKDKKDFIKKLTETRNREIFEMKREFSHLMDAAVQDFEQRLGIYKRDNEYLKMTMDQKVKNIIDQSDKKLETQSTLFEERRAADLKNSSTLADQKEHNWRTAMNETTANFSRKIDKMQIDNETTLKFITNDYENKIKEIKASNSKEIAQKDTLKQVELERLKTTYENGKNQLISAYESQIAALKTGFQEQIDSMKDYKRLS